MSDNQALAVLSEPLVPAVVFAEGGVDAVLKRIRDEVAQVEIDISTPSGRAQCASLAYKIARSKTALDAMGKTLGEDNYRAWKRITTERARIERELDALKDRVRKPLTDWENAERDRVEGHEGALRFFAGLLEFVSFEPTIHEIETHIGTARRQFENRDWQEFHKRAEDASIKTVAELMKLREQWTRIYADRAEAERLRQEEIDRQQRDRDERIAVEAAERAKREAEAKAMAEFRAAETRAKAERKRLANEVAEAEARAKRAEADRIAAEVKAKSDAEVAERARIAAAEKAERDKQAAIEAERSRIAAEQAKEKAAIAAREADRKHRATINGAARDAFVADGMPEEWATKAIMAIAKGAIPNVRISY